ncbi:MAG: phosphotransferase [Caldilineaceae bacterium]|nr:phosphotransferase [Caldilineaceae bacterium]
MPHELYSSLDEMLAPATLSKLEGRPIHYVRCLPFKSEDSLSGNRFLKVVTDDSMSPQYVVKRMSLAWDWLMRATEDEHCRSVRLWEAGLLDRLPPTIDHAIVACSKDGEGWAILMRDVGAGLVPPARYSQGLNEQLLTAQAQLHAAFWQSPELDDPALGLSSFRHTYTMLSPQTGYREADVPDIIPRQIPEGWELFRTLVAEDVAAIVTSLVEEPQPLCDALARYPRTLVHGDWRQPNLGRLPGEPQRTVLLDWQFATAGPPAIDLARYLSENAPYLPVDRDESIEFYRRQLVKELGDNYDESWWQPQLELSLLGGFLQSGWGDALGSIGRWGELPQELGGPGYWLNSLAWWSEQTLRAVKWL